MSLLQSARPDVPALVPARMLNAFVYCPRLFHLEWVQTEWADSADTLAGSRDHRRVDRETGDLPSPLEVAGGEGFTARSLRLSAAGEGLTARLDVLEGLGGEVLPVDYKHGHAPDGPDGVWDTDRIQLGAQALILRENGYTCSRAVVYYVASRRRIEIAIDDDLAEEVRSTRERALAAAASPKAPPPLTDSRKCPRCSLVGICLPDEHNHLGGLADPQPGDVRRLYPARDDALPVYVQAQGASVGKRGEELEIWERNKGKRRVRLMDCSQVSLFGNVQITSAALAALVERGIPICHFSYGGWFRGITHGLGSRNCALRLEQYRAAVDTGRSLEIARGFVARKIRNCRTLLRRNGEGIDEAVLKEMERLAVQTARTQSVESLLGVEGAAARIYFGSFARMLRGTGNGPPAFDFEGRNRRPPLDPVNALLSGVGPF